MYPYFANRLLQASNPILSIPSSNPIGPRVTFPQPNFTSNKLGFRLSDFNFKTASMDRQSDWFNNFDPFKPISDRPKVKGFHHVEFWCSDATTTARHFSFALGMPIVAKSDLSTGNTAHASYLLRSGDVSLLFTAPYSPLAPKNSLTATIPTFLSHHCFDFVRVHGLAVRAVAVEVEDAVTAFAASLHYGASVVRLPVHLDNGVELAEVYLFGDVVLRYVSCKNPSHDPNPGFLPGFERVEATSSDPSLDLGICGLDHITAIVPKLPIEMDYLTRIAGFHLGMNEPHSAALCNEEGTVFFKVTEPVYGESEFCRIENYLEHNEGRGIECLALNSNNLFTTVREMRKRTPLGGFEFTAAPSASYYEKVKKDFGHVLTNEQIDECQELAILIQRDDKMDGVVLQAVTMPIGDRPTMFLAIIQRVGPLMTLT